MDPVLCCLADEVLLAATCSTIARDWMSSGTHQIIELGKLDDEGIIIILEEGFRFQPSREDRFEMPLCLFLQQVNVGFARVMSRELTSCFLMIFWKPV